MGHPEEKPSEGTTELPANDERQGFHGKTNEVYSVALADAVAKDNVPMWSGNVLQLYLILVLVTLSK